MGIRIYADEGNIDVFEALASATRLKIIRLLSVSPMNIKEVSVQLDLSPAIITRHITVLEKCGIVKSKTVSAKHGRQKVCCLAAENITVFLNERSKIKEQRIVFKISEYSQAIDLQVPCGLEDENDVIGITNDQRYFMYPDRSAVKHLWFSNGMLKYCIAEQINGKNLKSVNIRLWLSVSSATEGCKHGQVFFGLCGKQFLSHSFPVCEEPIKIVLVIDEGGVALNGEYASRSSIKEIDADTSELTLEIGAGYYRGNKSVVNLYSSEEENDIEMEIQVN